MSAVKSTQNSTFVQTSTLRADQKYQKKALAKKLSGRGVELLAERGDKSRG